MTVPAVLLWYAVSRWYPGISGTRESAFREWLAGEDHAGPGPFRRVHRGVGRAQQIHRVGTGDLGDRDADAAAHRQRTALVRDRLADRLDQPQGQRPYRVRVVAGALGHHDELVPAQ